MPPESKTSDCIDYYVMDGWMEKGFGTGVNPLLYPVFSELYFLNPTQDPNTDLIRKTEKFLENYTAIREFSSSEYFGPTITVYKSKVKCP
jgi:hypothetical protein